MMTFIQARNFTPANRTAIRLIVIHSMEAPEKPGTALAVAKWFAGPNAPQASAHSCIDNAEVILCVHEKDIAWAAPGANRDGLHIEHAGYAKQSAADWSDPFSATMLGLSAEYAAEVAYRYGIPFRKLTVAEVADGKTKGFCGHVDVTNAFRKGTHVDPGGQFPWDTYLALVTTAAAAIQDTEPPVQKQGT